MRLVVRGLTLCALVVGCATAPQPVEEPAPARTIEPASGVTIPGEPVPPVEEPVLPAKEAKPAHEPPPETPAPLPAEPVAVPTPEPLKRAMPETCTYSTYQWSTVKRKAVKRRTVKKKYGELTADEKAVDFERSGCTVCAEDQVEVAVAGLPAIKVCWYYAPKVKEALEALHADPQFRIRELVGYRCGQTRGKLVNGLRTEFSNHSFGTAIDINSSFNGLYRRCDLKGKAPTSARDIARCKKGMGGIWDPDRNRKVTITPASKAYELFTTMVGWKWGGEIDGRLKDFMHFSVDGF